MVVYVVVETVRVTKRKTILVKGVRHMEKSFKGVGDKKGGGIAGLHPQFTNWPNPIPSYPDDEVGWKPKGGGKDPDTSGDDPLAKPCQGKYRPHEGDLKGVGEK
jgi:hypothetical protein